MSKITYRRVSEIYICKISISICYNYRKNKIKNNNKNRYIDTHTQSKVWTHKVKEWPLRAGTMAAGLVDRVNGSVNPRISTDRAGGYSYCEAVHKGNSLGRAEDLWTNKRSWRRVKDACGMVKVEKVVKWRLITIPNPLCAYIGLPGCHHPPKLPCLSPYASAL